MKYNTNKKIVFIQWVAWAGKWTLIDNILKNNPNDFKFVLSYKTRKKRPNEIDWVDAHFITLEDFKTKIKNNEFLEYEKVHNLSYYWTLKKDVIEKWILSWFNIIKEIDMLWIQNIYSNNPDLRDNIFSIFLNINNDLMLSRMKERDSSISDNEILARLETANTERVMAKRYCDISIDISEYSKEDVLNKFNFLVKNLKI